MKKILVVDDSAVDRKIAGGYVEELGAQAVYATDGVDALEIMLHDTPDIVLTDLQMPAMDGLELVRSIRRHHAQVPVILMTAYGSEKSAVAALREGAASFVTKKNMKRDLRPALNAVLSAVEASQDRERVHQFLQKSSAHFVLGYDPAGPRALISYLREGLAQLNYCDDAELTQVSTALIEALSNAINHGNLELDSAIRESDSDRYRELGKERAAISPYRERRVNVTSELTPSRATFVVTDEGPGFDPSNLPDPTDPANVLKPSGRGVLLMHTFMDEVSFNKRGNEVTMVKRPSDLR